MKNVKELIKNHHDITLKLAFIDAVLSLSSENFMHHDGLEPPSMIITDDGRRVPEPVIQEMMDELKKRIRVPLEQELSKLNRVKL